MEIENIKGSIEQRRFLLPQQMNRHVALRLIREGRFDVLGEYFNFEPKQHNVGGILMFDWNCLPPVVQALLNDKPKQAPSRRPARRAGKSFYPFQLQPIRQATFQLQNGLCYYCGNKTISGQWTIDHKTPKARGGKNGQDNRVGCCANCNQAKGCMTVAEFLSTDYLTRERRAALGWTQPPKIQYHQARDAHDQWLAEPKECWPVDPIDRAKN